MSRIFAGRWAKSWGDRLYTLSYYIVEQNRLGFQLLIHWRTHSLGFCRKPNHISIRWLGHPNPNSLISHSRSIPCLNTLVGSVRDLVTLLKYSLFHYIVEFYPTCLHCWAIHNPNTLLRYTLSYYIAKHISTTDTLLSFTQSCHIVKIEPILLHCWAFPNFHTYWALPNPNTLLRYTLSYYTAKQFPNTNTLLSYT